MTDENRFCTACGARLPEGAAFCPECGRGADGGANPYSRPQGHGGQPASSKGPGLQLFILVYGVMALALGAILTMDGLSITEEAYNQLLDMYRDYQGMDMSGMLPPWTDTLQLQMVLSGVFTLASALCALGCYWFCRMKGPKRNAVILCLLADVLVLGMCAYWLYAVYAVPLFLIGAFVTYRLHSDRTGFES